MDLKRNATSTAFLDACSERLDAGLTKIKHCVGQLSNAQIWWRPCLHKEANTTETEQESPLNSIANLLLHLDGNVRQWLIAGLGAADDERTRQEEFDDRSGKNASELLSQLEATLEEARRVIMALGEQDILQVRRVQEFHFNGAQVMLDSISHFQGHVQEIVHITRIQLGSQYEFDFTPAD